MSAMQLKGNTTAFSVCANKEETPEAKGVSLALTAVESGDCADRETCICV